MMKQIALLVLAVSLAYSGISAQISNLDEILTRYYKVNGFDKLQKVNTIIMSGSITRNDLMPVKITKMRPNRYRMDFELADLEAVQAYDGTTGWSITPRTGNPKATVMDEETLKDVKVRADFDGILYKWKEKGHIAELAGLDTIENKQVYKIKLIRKDGGIEYYFIDNQNFQLKKRAFTKIIRGKEVEIENIFSDYKQIDGMWFSYTNETNVGGQRYSLIEFDKIELNLAVDEKIFYLPL
jgi:hypothetical protein